MSGKKDPTNSELPAIGFIELSSISRGLYLTDIIIKKAPIKMLASHPISSGKHILMYMGDVASVDSSHKAALDQSGGTLLKEVMISGIHPELSDALEYQSTGNTGQSRSGQISADDSVGIVESQTMTGAVLAADQALKTANVSLFRLRLGQGIGGKAYFVLRGKQDEIEAALERAESTLKELDSLGRTDMIAAPDLETLGHF